MTPQQIQTVQASFADVQPIAGTAVELFHTRLFTLDPSLRSLFRGDVQEQRQMLMAMIGSAVQGLDRLDELAVTIRQLGARHAHYGVCSEHYDTVGEALLWTLQHGLGPRFTPAVRDAWYTAYSLLADVMQLGALEESCEATA